MSRILEGFNKTDHFMYRQWDRNITDKSLSKILKRLDKSKKKTLIIVSRKILKKIGVNCKKELFIKLDKSTLITCFYSDMQTYLGTKREQNYLIINNILYEKNSTN